MTRRRWQPFAKSGSTTDGIPDLGLKPGEAPKKIPIVEYRSLDDEKVRDEIRGDIARQKVRDRIEEETFFAIFGSPVVQGMLGVNGGEKVRELPGTTPEKRAAEKALAVAYAAKVRAGGFDEALARAVLYVVAAERALDERCAHALYAARRDLLHLPIDHYKTLVRDQFFVLLLERERAVEALATMVREADQRAELLKRTSAIIGAGDPPTAEERERIARLEKVLVAPVTKRAALTASSRGTVETETSPTIVTH